MSRELVQFDGVSQNVSEELTLKLRAVKEEALRNLITGKTPKKVVFKRPVRGGGEVDYVPGWWFIQQANALFNHQWSHIVVDKQIGSNQIWTQDRVTVHLPGMTVTERRPDGTVIETRFDPVDISKDQFGSSDVKKYVTAPKGKQVGDIIDIGDDLKASATEGMKKCLTGYGLAADIYGQRDTNEASQFSALYSVGKKQGMTTVQVDEWCTKETGKKSEDLTQMEILGLLAKLRTKV